MNAQKLIQMKLEEWVERGFLTQEQRQAIEVYESDQSSTNRLSFALTLLAGCSIVLGIVALIATNWEHLTPSFKLAGYFVLFAGTGAVYLWRSSNTSTTKEVLRIVMMGLVMAGIGLVAQIYHLNSSAWRGLAFWSLCTILLALSSTSIWGASLWLSLVFSAAIKFMDSIQVTDSLKLLLTAGLFTVFGIWSNFKVPVLETWKQFRKVGFWMALGGSSFLSLAAAYSTYFTIGQREWIGLLVLIAVWAFSVRENRLNLTRAGKIWYLIFLLCLALQVLFFPVLHGSEIGKTLRILFSSVFFVGGTLAIGLSAFYQGQRRLFEGVCLFLFLRLLILYFELLMSLAFTGGALIVLGVLIIVALKSWMKWKELLFVRLERRK